MKKTLIDLKGKKIGRLLVIDRCESPELKKSGTTKWNCICECGKKVSVRAYALTRSTKSCGCIRWEVLANKSKKRSGLFEYGIWRTMISRCYTKSVRVYKNYGGKGITVCDRWLSSFDNFINDMGLRPSDRHSIERNDNNKGYCPENCRWATYSDQAKNRSNNYYIEFNNERMILSDWARKIGITSGSLAKRIKRWGIEEALSRPKKHANYKEAQK